MSLKRGNVQPQASQAAAAPPALDPNEQQLAPPPAAPPDQPPAAAAPPPAQPPSTAPAAQEQTAAAQAGQATAAPPPVASPPPAAQLPAVPVSAGVSSGVVAQLESEGFSGLEFGYGSFPMITLQNSGMFETSEGGNLGTEFQCTMLGSVTKWVYKNTGYTQKKDEDMCFSYDNQYTTAGQPLADVIDGWKNSGFGYEVKKYLDVQAVMVTSDEDNGAMVMLSIPPTSVARFSGYMATLRTRYGADPKAVVSRCSVGDKVTGVQFPFNPWNFDYVGAAAT